MPRKLLHGRRMRWRALGQMLPHLGNQRRPLVGTLAKVCAHELQLLCRQILRIDRQLRFVGRFHDEVEHVQADAEGVAYAPGLLGDRLPRGRRIAYWAQAEAVADLIDASTGAAARSAVRSLQGDFSREIGGLQAELTELRALVEATLDFPEEEVDFLEAANAFGRLDRLDARLGEVFARARQGRLLQGGLHVVLVGQPNVGKSSLLNRLAGEERAIVTDIAGTTRDALRETIQIEGIPLHITDTAGLRDTNDEVEKIGIARTWQEIERADVIVRLVDVRAGLTEADAAIDARLPAGVERITVFNKVDLAGRDAQRVDTDGAVSLYLSAKAGQGIELLRAELLRVAGWHRHGEDIILARERHLIALREALARIHRALDNHHALELMAEELRLAQEAVNEITGEFTPDDLLGVIFSRFCIGK